jgi:hypothetical protein
MHCISTPLLARTNERGDASWTLVSVTWPVQPSRVTSRPGRCTATWPAINGAQRLLTAAELAKKAAQQQRLPSVQVNGDVGALGRTPATAANTYTATAALKIPIFQGGKVRSDVEEADAILRRRQAEVQDLRARIETDVRTAFLDLSATDQQVQVAKSSMELAQQTLQQAQDRFSAGVTTNLEVIQAQEAIAATNENFIATLFAFNFAKLACSRSGGSPANSRNSVPCESTIPARRRSGIMSARILESSLRRRWLKNIHRARMVSRSASFASTTQSRLRRSRPLRTNTMACSQVANDRTHPSG